MDSYPGRNEKDADDRLRLALDAAGIFIWDCDLASGRIEWSDNAAFVIGCDAGELPHDAPRGFFFVAEEDRPRILAEYERALASGQPAFRAEFRGRGDPGQARYFLAEARVHYDAAGRPVRIVGATHDITQRRRTELALFQSAEMFRTLADNISQLAWMADEKGSIFWYNKRWYDYTGTTLEEMQGWGWRAVHHPDHVDRVVAKIQHAWDTGETWEDTFPLRSKDGEYRWFLSRALPIRDAEGRIVRWFGTNTDITEQREAEQALREVDRRKDEFIALLAHELRNPLAPIQNAVTYLDARGSTDPGVVKCREIIHRQVRQMSRLLDDLLDTSRLVRGKLTLSMRRMALREAIHAAIEQSRPSIDRKEQLLEVYPTAEPLFVEGDPGRLTQVFTNLLNNASKYSGIGARIRVSLSTEDGVAVVKVGDSGRGMSAELMARIFQPFVQGEPSAGSTPSGLGLGLALSRRLVEMHGGHLTAASDGEGQGSEFVVRLPLVG